MNLTRRIGVALVVLGVGIAVLCTYFLATSPVAFQKTSAVTVAEPADLKIGAAVRWFDIRKLMEKIPYKGGMVHEVDPARKYRKTIEEGYGNCANLSFGLGYHLQQQSFPYQIVHMLPWGNFLDGDGHSLVNMPYTVDGKRHYALVDVLDGGLVADDRGFVDVAGLRRGQLANPRILPLNALRDDSSPYYGEFRDKAEIGIIKHTEIASYFAFLEAFYIPLGSTKIEKIAYDGLAVVIGVYPRIYVEAEAFDRLYAGRWSTWLLGGALLVSIRVFVLLGLVWLSMLALTAIWSSGLWRARLTSVVREYPSQARSAVLEDRQRRREPY